MPSTTDLYRRLDERLRAFSRGRYALTVGVFVFAVSLATSTLLGDPELVSATAMGVTFTAIYYYTNPNESDATSE
ncbi:hypothetical protein [Halogeometricum limi]|uniref:Uncharacterized protein n=1 Tax=Halogeometricum limi TaxID=555875 RepID=A0A1I6FS70_9EURY|nr:hypothetical protein [Halogeometricum limi]SFR32800.1 hypothetical protein SAMN04488124_0187 [Halogeometricum limi]